MANPGQEDGDGDGVGDLCDPCPAQRDNANCDPDASAAAIIGPDGGTIATPDGSVTVTIPPGGR